MQAMNSSTTSRRMALMAKIQNASSDRAEEGRQEAPWDVSTRLVGSAGRRPSEWTGNGCKSMPHSLSLLQRNISGSQVFGG